MADLSNRSAAMRFIFAFYLCIHLCMVIFSDFFSYLDVKFSFSHLPFFRYFSLFSCSFLSLFFCQLFYIFTCLQFSVHALPLRHYVQIRQISYIGCSYWTHTHTHTQSLASKHNFWQELWKFWRYYVTYAVKILLSRWINVCSHNLRLFIFQSSKDMNSVCSLCVCRPTVKNYME